MDYPILLLMPFCNLQKLPSLRLLSSMRHSHLAYFRRVCWKNACGYCWNVAICRIYLLSCQDLHKTTQPAAYYVIYEKNHLPTAIGLYAWPPPLYWWKCDDSSQHHQAHRHSVIFYYTTIALLLNQEKAYDEGVHPLEYLRALVIHKFFSLLTNTGPLFSHQIYISSASMIVVI